MPADRILPAFFTEERQMSEIGGMNIQAIAQKYGTPCVVYDENILRNRLREFTENFKSDEFRTDVI